MFVPGPVRGGGAEQREREFVERLVELRGFLEIIFAEALGVATRSGVRRGRGFCFTVIFGSTSISALSGLAALAMSSRVMGLIGSPGFGSAGAAGPGSDRTWAGRS